MNFCFRTIKESCACTDISYRVRVTEANSSGIIKVHINQVSVTIKHVPHTCDPNTPSDVM